MRYEAFFMMDLKKTKWNDVIMPVILEVPESARRLKGREKTGFLSSHARKALMRSAEKSGFLLEKLDKDKMGAPLPFKGVFWSISHKEEYVAAAASCNPVGIDIEKIRACPKSLYVKIASEAEWLIFKDSVHDPFFRCWTAKEAVLKVERVGLTGLSRCRISAAIDDALLVVSFENREWFVRQYYHDGHVASVVVSHDDRVEWQVC